jgi:hypothetical protein
MKFVFAALSGVLFCACVESEKHFTPAGPAWGSDAGICQDADGDGYGEGCSQGGDCDDRNPTVHTDCGACAIPQQGCDCAATAKPVSCYLSPTVADDGSAMCHEGTRYCRNSQWSGCEAINSYPRPPATDPQALINPSDTPQQCNDCSINCYVVRDTLAPTMNGIGSTSTNSTQPSGGGLTLQYVVPDAGTIDSGMQFDPSKCVLGTAPDHDCDGIPDMYDPYPDQKPFATANPTLFLDIAPGQTQTGVIQLAFFLNSADVYFLMDQTLSMGGERDTLKSSLVSGDFINDASYNCADYDFDFKPNNELKAQGIIGAIRCIIRDANFGLGYLREIPFAIGYHWSNGVYEPYYGPNDSVAFRHLQDVTSSIPSVSSAVARLTTIGNYDWPESTMPAINSVITGNGLYFGADKPVVPPRTGCPANTFGYPCFRSTAIPVIVLFTDAMLHNGPSVGAANWNYTSPLAINSGTTTTIPMVGSANETYASAYDLGDVTSTYATFMGDTTGMTSDFNHTTATCNNSAAPNAPDAMFKFSLSSTKTIKATTVGSDFDTTVTILKGAPRTITPLPSFPNTNDTASSAYSFGNAVNQYVSVSGNSSTLNSDYSANDIACSSAAGAKDAAFTFSLASATKIALDTGGSSYGTVLGLYSGTVTSPTYAAAISNTNDSFATAYAIGAADGKNLGFFADTSAAGITAGFTGAQLACPAVSTPADAAPDAVFSFTLAGSKHMRISAEDSTVKPVLALVNNGLSFPSPVPSGDGNETDLNAYNIGAADGTIQQFTGNTSGMIANYTGTQIGCGAADGARDAVYKFTLAASKTVQIDTAGSGFDTVLGLYKNAVTGDTPVTLASNINETAATALSLGTINAKRYVVSGGTTTGMIADYTDTQISCSAASISPDAVFSFHVNTTTTVKLDTAGSSYDTVMSLHKASPDVTVTTVASNTNEVAASATVVNPSSSASNLRYDGSTATMTPDIAVDNGAGCSAAVGGTDAVYKVVVPVAGAYEFATTGSSYDTVLGLFPSTVYNPTPPTPVAEGTAGDLLAGAIPIGSMDGQWKSFTGSTASAAGNKAITGTCAVAAGSGNDVFYSFTLAAAHSLVIDTVGSSFDTTIAVLNAAGTSQLSCNNDVSTGVLTSQITTSSLAAGTYLVLVKGHSALEKGNYKLTLRDVAVSTTTNLLACDDNSGGGTTSKISYTAAAGTYYLVVKGHTAVDKGAYRFAVRALNYSDANRLSCNDDASVVITTSQITQTNLVAGDYYVVIKGKAAVPSGNYVLTVQDMTTPPSATITCNDDVSATVNSSIITQTLAAGTYYIVVKGFGTATTNGSYFLNIKDNAAVMATTYQCDYNSGAGGTALIDRTLSAGTYRVIVKGKAATDKGPYKLVVRDLTALPNSEIGCDHSSGTGGASHLEASLSAGTYTAVIKGDAASSAGPYSLSLLDKNNVQLTDVVSTCNNDSTISGTTYTYSTISQSLTAGTYYALVKGNATTDFGQYQLNIGAGAMTADNFVAPTYAQTLAALQAKQARVISVISCHDDPSHGDAQGDCNSTRSQVTTIANATNTLGYNLQPLVFDINGDGSGLSKSVVQGVAALAHYLEMNVSVRVVFSPDANPGFSVAVKAVDSPGDGCNGVVNNEHQSCAPGANPRFEIAFTNPLHPSVPLNLNDPHGGYNFRAELIGNQQFVVDQVPIYVIPTDVTGTTKPVAQVVASGTYWQDISSPGCVGTQRPSWNDLTWNAVVPKGTSVAYSVCASDKSTDLTTCPLTALAKITGGGACTTSAQCSNGYCSGQGNCQTITGGACSTSTDCTGGATCVAHVCTYSGQPISVFPVLPAQNYSTSLRMQIALTSNQTDNTAPVVNDWSLTYVCNAIQ